MVPSANRGGGGIDLGAGDSLTVATAAAAACPEYQRRTGQARRPAPTTFTPHGRRRPSRHPERALVTVPTPGTGSEPIILPVAVPTRLTPDTPPPRPSPRRPAS